MSRVLVVMAFHAAIFFAGGVVLGLLLASIHRRRERPMRCDLPGTCTRDGRCVPMGHDVSPEDARMAALVYPGAEEVAR